MSVKRKHVTDDDHVNKRSRGVSGAEGSDSRASGYEIKSRVDPMTGQRGAFPGLDESIDPDRMFYGPASDGLEYLRMVRAEAQSVPSMVAASVHVRQRPERHDRRADAHDISSASFWADEAVIAAPVEGTHDLWDDQDDEEEDLDAQDVYYAALLKRFGRLRTQLAELRQAGTARVAADISTDTVHPTNFRATYKQWYHGFVNRPPVIAHIVGLSQDRVMLGLERLEKVLKRSTLSAASTRSNLGAWAWALLARCRERSTMNGDDTGIVRSLAKRAQKLDAQLRGQAHLDAHIDSDADTEVESIQQGDDGKDLIGEVDEPPADTANTEDSERRGVATESNELELARHKLMQAVNSDMEQANTAGNGRDGLIDIDPSLMLLESVVTIVGELYGQRDLLEQRPAW